MISQKPLIIIAICVALAAGGIFGFLLGKGSETNDIVSKNKEKTAVAGVLQSAEGLYICPMHPWIVNETADICPICGMDLVAASGNKQIGGNDTTVTIAPAVVNNLGVRSVKVERRSLHQQIDTIGYVEFDRTRLLNVYPGAEGTIADLSLTSEGERVQKGQFLFRILSPMVGSYYDETYATQGGIIAALNVYEGMFVDNTTNAVTIGDLSRVWVLAEVFESQVAWLQSGQTAEVRLPYFPGRVWQGKVEYIYPSLDPETRTLKVRMRFDNPDEALKPNMHAEVTILAGHKQDILAIPSDALINTGRQQRVILDLSDGRFEPREVSIGAESDGWVEVTDGLTEKDWVVVSGQFLIDSESNFQASLKRMAPGEHFHDRDDDDHDHDDHDDDHDHDMHEREEHFFKDLE